jgi:hypothetical protein
LSTSNIVQSGPEALAHDEGELGFHARGDEALGRDQPSIGKEHVVEQHAGIRLVDVKRTLHRLRGQADLVAFDDASLRDLDVDPRLLDCVGITHADVGKILRELSDLRAGFLRLVQTARASLDIVMGERHAQSLKCGCREIINMLSEFVKPHSGVLQCKHFRV